MRITHGNTVLRSLTEDDLEMVRGWRNDPHVNAHLLNRAYISEKAQLEWFQNLNPECSLYLVMEELGQPFGLVYATDIDLQGRSYWGNVIIGDNSLRNSLLPVRAVCMLMLYFFNELNFQSVLSQVSTDNRAARQLNQKLGFVLQSEKNGLRREVCERHGFESTGGRLAKHLLRGEPLMISHSASDAPHT